VYEEQEWFFEVIIISGFSEHVWGLGMGNRIVERLMENYFK
jgi:hypothetical protein